MKKILFAGVMTLVLYSCHQAIAPVSIFKPDQLPTQQVTINTSRDTVIYLEGGTQLSIPAHALSGEMAVLKVKEALTITDMIMAGLTTRSDSNILSSGGMIYIDSDARLLKPIQVTMSPAYVDTDMQLFQGTVTPSGINWTNPQPLNIYKDTAAIARGKSLYEGHCASCHYIDTATIAPPLLGAMERWRNDTFGLFYYIRSNELIPTSDRYIGCLRRMYKARMTRFPLIEREALNDIFTFVQEEGMKKYGGVPSRFKTGCCYFSWEDQRVKDSLESLNYSYAQEMDYPNVNASDYIDVSSYPEPYSDIQFSDSTTAQDSAEEVTPPQGQSTTTRSSRHVATSDQEKPPPAIKNNYSFLIKNFGWYNIDKFEMENESLLTVDLKGAPYSRISVMLVIPGDKVLMTAYKTEGYFYFKWEDGRLPLPPDKLCYIIAMGQKDTIPLFGISSFISRSSQNITVDVQVSNDKDIATQITAIDLNGIKIIRKKN
jgi:hypothetical protein